MSNWNRSIPVVECSRASVARFESPLRDVIPLISTKLLLICAIVGKKKERKEELSSWFCTRELNSSYAADCSKCHIQLRAWITQIFKDLVNSIAAPWEQRPRWPVSAEFFLLSTLQSENINNKKQHYYLRNISPTVHKYSQSADLFPLPGTKAAM